MQLQFNFNLLLVGIFVVLSCSGGAIAAPTRRAPGVVTIPLRSLHNVRSGEIHPQLLLQQHINRSHRRLARMTGREEPSASELRSNLQRRIDHIHAGFAAGTHSHSKRYVVLPSNSTKGSQLATAQEITTGPLSGLNKLLGNIKGEATNSKAAGDGREAKGQNSNGAAGNTGSTTGANSTTTDTSSASSGSDNSTGFSEIDLEAASNGGLTDANAPTASQSVGLDIEADDVGYIGEVQIGTPPQNFLILMDSGSADFWVGAENCQSQAGGGCGNHTFLGSQSSSSFQATDQNFQVTYGTGNVAGTVITDDVTLAGLSLPGHTFGVATSESVDFSSDQTPFDGLMGLAQSTLSQQQTLTPVESLAKAGTIQQAITSFKISRLADQKNDGEVTFGGVDSTKFDPSTITTFDNVNQDGFWEGAMVPTVNGQSVGLDSGRTAILDTGTTLIVAPPNDAAAIHAAITGAKSDGQGGFTVPCTTTDVVSLAFGNQTFDIDPRDIAFLPVDQNDLTGDCTSGISSGQVGGADEWLVGDVFLKNAYFSTNVNTNTISLAKLV